MDTTNISITGSGSTGLRTEAPLVNLDGGSFSDNAYGLFIAGSSTVVADGIIAQDNSVTGLVLYDDASLTLRRSTLRGNDWFNLHILGSPAVIDLGTQGEPGNNTFEANAMTQWRPSHPRPSLDGPHGVVVTVHGNVFVSSTGVRRSYDAALEVVTGPDSRNHDWRITGTNQRMRF
jgi:hypothetical protein